MKKQVLFAASVAAASASAISASSSTFNFNSNFQFSRQEDDSKRGENLNSSTTDKFAPRFDGLRFIETLVTAHR